MSKGWGSAAGNLVPVAHHLDVGLSEPERVPASDVATPRSRLECALYSRARIGSIRHFERSYDVTSGILPTSQRALCHDTHTLAVWSSSSRKLLTANLLRRRTT